MHGTFIQIKVSVCLHFALNGKFYGFERKKVIFRLVHKYVEECVLSPYLGHDTP
jgi:hypothetical protein